MTEILAAAVEALQAKLDGGNFPASAKFVIRGEGAVRIEGATVAADDSEADVTMTADVETFQGIMEGDINPTTAFMTGRLKIEGDMGVAMKLGALLA